MILIDDSISILVCLQQILQPYCTVKTFSDPTKAFAFFQKEKLEGVSLIVCDEKMPEMSGTYLMAEAYQISPQTSRMMLTAYKDFDVAQNALNRGKVNYFMTKPINSRKFIERTLAFFELYTFHKLQEHSLFYQKLNQKHLRQLKLVTLVYQGNTEPFLLLPGRDHYHLLAFFYQSLRRYYSNKPTDWSQYQQLTTDSDTHLASIHLHLRLNMLKAADTIRNLNTSTEYQEELFLTQELLQLMKHVIRLIDTYYLHFSLNELACFYPTLLQWCLKENLLTEPTLTIMATFLSHQSSPPLEFYTLGSFHIMKNQQHIDCQKLLNRKQFQLLTILLSQPEKKVPVDLILEHLWPKSSAKNGMNLFYTNLYQLRRSLDPFQDQPASGSIFQYKDGLCWLNTSKVWVEDWSLSQKMKAAKKILLKPYQEDYTNHCLEVVLKFRDQYLPEHLYFDWIEGRRLELVKELNEVLGPCLSQLEKHDPHESLPLLLAKALELNPESEHP